MGCHHRIAYLFLLLLHILLLGALALPLKDCKEIKNCPPYDNTAASAPYLVGVALSIVTLILILLNVCKCSAIHKWKKTIKKKFRWIALVLLLTAVVIIVSYVKAGVLTPPGDKPEPLPTARETEGAGLAEDNKQPNSPENYLPYITLAAVATELLLVLFMLCCKPAKKKEKKDDDNDDDVADKGNGGGKGTGNGGDKTGGNGAPGTMVVDMSKPIQINLNIPGLSGGGVKTGGPFRMLHATTPSNVYGSSN